MSTLAARLTPAALIGAACLALYGHRHHDAVALRQEFARVPARTNTAPLGDSAAAVSGKPAPVTAVAATAPLSEAERRELLTLRRDVGELRRQLPRLATAQAENARLHAAVGALPPAGGPAAPPAAASATGPAGFVRMAQAHFAGFATPTDAVQSFFWGLANRDTNVLTQAFGAEVAGNMLQSLNETPKLPGFFIHSVAERPDGTAEVAWGFDPRAPDQTDQVKLVKTNGAWRLVP